jgi:putative permease
LVVKNLDIEEKIRNGISMLTDQLITMLANIISFISIVVIVPFVVFFLLKDGRKMKKAFIHFVPNRYFEMTLNVIHKIDQQLGWYLRGQFTEAFVVGMLSVIALWLLDVQYFIIIGTFAGFANMIPYVGPVAGAVPAIIVTLLNGDEPIKLLYIIIAFAIVQLIDNIVVQPLVLSKSVHLHPLIIVFAVLIGGQFFGLLGMLLAVPAAGIIKVTSSELYEGIRKFNLA